jgi:HrpA-like RNA helicase
LRIKTLHENEKNTKKRVDEHLFSNPKVVLGRAIEPPQLESIGIAMKNLQDCGALTAAEDSTLAEITYLGKVYCDLPCEVKISKLILLGLAFEIGEEVITLGSILS